MRVFYGGQIKEEHRGDLATVIMRQGIGNKKSPTCNVFIYPPNSEEFVHLTGILDAITKEVEKTQKELDVIYGNMGSRPGPLPEREASLARLRAKIKKLADQM